MLIFKLLKEILEGLGHVILFPFFYLQKRIKIELPKIKAWWAVVKKVLKTELHLSRKKSKKKRKKNSKRHNPLPNWKIKLSRIKVPSFLKLSNLPKLPKLPAISSPKINLPAIPKNIIYFTVGVLAALILIFLPYLLINWFRSLPDVAILAKEGSHRSTRILDRNGKLLYEYYVDRNYNPVKLSEIPDMVKNATIAVEDADFYSHKGLNIKSVIRAVRETFFRNNLQGGSTITQQLVKNMLLTPERTLSRKIKEAILALKVETKYSKDQILELYLNNTPYGGTSWGIQSASRKYFGKDVWQLSLAEAALLAGLPSSPTTYSPITNLEGAKARQKYVLDRMVALKKISEEEKNTALAEPIVIAEQTDYIRAPHFVNYIENQLEGMFGTRMVNLGGLMVTTSLDLDLQDKVQKEVTGEIARYGDRLGFSNGAAVVLEAKTNEIMAYVGSVDYFNEQWGSYDVATAYRQPGSSIKPVTYALALTKGKTLANTLDDSPVAYKMSDGTVYSPVNYDGKFHGAVTLRQALANSYNIPAVKLAAEIGPDNIVSLGRDMGLTNWAVGDNYGLSVTLGGKEVRLVDHVNVFADFARGGVYKNVKPILSIIDEQGHELYQENPETKTVISSEVGYLIWSALSDNNARYAAFGPASYLVVPGYTVAVKTGTTDNKKDNWTVGFTPSYVVGVWVGNNDGRPMNPYLASGVTGAAPIWNRVFKLVLQGKPNELMPVPSGVFLKSDSACGRSEYFIIGSFVPKALCPVDKAKEDEKKKKHKD
jgi:1A family penicillin-binding protein